VGTTAKLVWHEQRSLTVETKAAQKSKTRSRNQDRAAMKSEEMKQDTGLVSRFFTGQEKNENKRAPW
jgi:hypothetical protein